MARVCRPLTCSAVGSVAMCAPHTHRHLLQLCAERRCTLLSCHYRMSRWSSSRPTPRASPAAVFQPRHLEHTGRNRMEKAHGSPHQYGSLGRTEWTTDAEKQGECRARSSVCWVIMKIVEMFYWDCCKCRLSSELIIGSICLQSPYMYKNHSVWFC